MKNKVVVAGVGMTPFIGGTEKFVMDNQNTYGGKIVTNPSGGLLSKGHPLGRCMDETIAKQPNFTI